MQTSTRGLLALMRREAVVLSVYKDSKGVLTVGVGHTAAAGDPRPVAGQTITLVQALSIFRRDIAKYEREVAAAIKAPLAQHEFDALVSFHYNTGGIHVAKLTSFINVGRRDEATIKAGFRGWLQPPEIEDRRMEEYEQFMFADYGDTSTVPVYDAFPGKVRRVSTAGLLDDPVPAPVPEPTSDPAPIPPPPDIEPVEEPAAQPATSGGLFHALKALLEALFGRK